jgi:hypothetical protein
MHMREQKRDDIRTEKLGMLFGVSQKHAQRGRGRKEYLHVALRFGEGAAATK